MALHAQQSEERASDELAVRPQFNLLGEAGEVPRFRLGVRGMSARTAYDVVTDELLLDSRARLNLATFVTTWMEDEGKDVIHDNLTKNLIDKDEYPQTNKLEGRCVNILADLWHAGADETAVGCSTTGSSEGCMLGGMALKWRWRARRQQARAATDRPNLVMGSNVQVCWERFCRYWDVEPREVPVSSQNTHLTAAGAVDACDENTIGVVALLGSTYDGSYEPIADIAGALDDLAQKGPDIPIHVDAASGGFVAPFLDPTFVWDFRLPRVHSINSSGHKYGLVYPGIGWVLWRDSSVLPKELIFTVDYLGGEMPTLGLNFSRPGAFVAAQYYNFIRFGFDGYKRIHSASRHTARWLSGAIAGIGQFELLSDGSQVPCFAFRLRDGCSYTVYDISDRLRARGWVVPAYTMPKGIENVSVLRIVVRNGFRQELAEQLLEDLRAVVAQLEGAGRTTEERTGFHH
ncbi:MAG: glutamate decarboxylase [Acidimicrobiia bacterium]|nr:glutamate decarboxylase [Acidimicrobiia bacterium]